MDNEIALLIEQSRQTYDLVKANNDLLQHHIEDDKLVAETVVRHSTYWGITKWIVITLVGFIVSVLGFKHLS